MQSSTVFLPQSRYLFNIQISVVILKFNKHSAFVKLYGAVKSNQIRIPERRGDIGRFKEKSEIFAL